MNISGDAVGLAGGGLAGAAGGTVRAGLAVSGAAGVAAPAGGAGGLSGVPSLFASHLDVATGAAPAAPLAPMVEGMSVSAAALMDGLFGATAPVLNFSLVSEGADGVAASDVAPDAQIDPLLLVADEPSAIDADEVTLAAAEGALVPPPVVAPVMFPALPDGIVETASFGTDGDLAGDLAGNLAGDLADDLAGDFATPPAAPDAGSDEGNADRPPVVRSAGTTDAPGFFPSVADTPAGGQPVAEPAAPMAPAPSAGLAAATVPLTEPGLDAGLVVRSTPGAAEPVVKPVVGAPGAPAVQVGAGPVAAAPESAVAADDADVPPLKREAALPQMPVGASATRPVAAAPAGPNGAQAAPLQAVQPVATAQVAPLVIGDVAQAVDADGVPATEVAKSPVDPAQPLRAATTAPAAAQNNAAQAPVVAAGVQNTASQNTTSQNTAGQNMLGQTSLDGEGQPGGDAGDGAESADADGVVRPQTNAAATEPRKPVVSSTMTVQAAAAPAVAVGVEVLGGDLADGGDGYEAVAGNTARSGQPFVTPASNGAPAAQTLPMALMAMEITRNAQRGQTRFEIRLDPPELGRVDVRLKIGDDGQVRAHLIVERPETLDMMQRDQRGMERALENAGLKTASDGGLSFSLKDQGGQASADGGNEHRETNGFGEAVAGDQPVDQQAALERVAAYTRGGASGLDIRV
ncbi:flagellar hook-length control protein FliK [Breoghania sp. L-A4]|uniref:flagellar hook-length control protein FliK n=1 Tax=Breoghania sp. L-A4 TaxID=2304600 RepID=UPI0013C2FC0B|nr:flagellar hook-length control protein FliK [Breoghania sp. L-A4]